MAMTFDDAAYERLLEENVLDYFPGFQRRHIHKTALYRLVLHIPAMELQRGEIEFPKMKLNRLAELVAQILWNMEEVSKQKRHFFQSSAATTWFQDENWPNGYETYRIDGRILECLGTLHKVQVTVTNNNGRKLALHFADVSATITETRGPPIENRSNSSSRSKSSSLSSPTRRSSSTATQEIEIESLAARSNQENSGRISSSSSSTQEDDDDSLFAPSSNEQSPCCTPRRFGEQRSPTSFVASNPAASSTSEPTRLNFEDPESYEAVAAAVLQTLLAAVVSTSDADALTLQHFRIDGVASRHSTVEARRSGVEGPTSSQFSAASRSVNRRNSMPAALDVLRGSTSPHSVLEPSTPEIFLASGSPSQHGGGQDANDVTGSIASRQVSKRPAAEDLQTIAAAVPPKRMCIFVPPKRMCFVILKAASFVNLKARLNELGVEFSEPSRQAMPFKTCQYFFTFSVYSFCDAEKVEREIVMESWQEKLIAGKMKSGTLWHHLDVTEIVKATIIATFFSVTGSRPSVDIHGAVASEELLSEAMQNERVIRLIQSNLTNGGEKVFRNIKNSLKRK